MRNQTGKSDGMSLDGQKPEMSINLIGYTMSSLQACHLCSGIHDEYIYSAPPPKISLSIISELQAVFDFLSTAGEQTTEVVTPLCLIPKKA